MTVTKYKRIRYVAIRAETRPGQEVSLSSSNVVLQVYDASITSEITRGSVPYQFGMGTKESDLSNKKGSIKFSIAPNGDSGWASALLPHCGLSGSGYTPSIDVDTVTIGIFDDGSLKTLRGAVGTFQMNFTTNETAELTFDFKGIWGSQTSQVLPTIVESDIKPYACRELSTPFSFDGWSPCIDSFSVDLGNKIEYIPASNDESGYRQAIIKDREIKGAFTALAEDVTAYGKLSSNVEGAIVYGLNGSPTDVTPTGSDMTVSISKAQITGVSESEYSGIHSEKIDWRAIDDGISITI